MRTHRKTWVPAMVRKVAAVTLLLQMSLTGGSSEFKDVNCSTYETGRCTIIPSSECWPAPVGEPSGQSTGHGSMPPLTSLRLGLLYNHTSGERALQVTMSSRDASLGNSKQLKLKLMEMCRFPESSDNSLCLSIDVQGATSQEQDIPGLRQSLDIAVTVTLPTNRTSFFLEMAVPESKLSPRRYLVKIETLSTTAWAAPVIAVTSTPGKGLLYIWPPQVHEADTNVNYIMTLVACASQHQSNPEVIIGEMSGANKSRFDQLGFGKCTPGKRESELDYDQAVADPPLEVPLEAGEYMLQINYSISHIGGKIYQSLSLRTPTFRMPDQPSWNIENTSQVITSRPAREHKYATHLRDPQYSTQDLRSAGRDLGNSENVPGLTAVISGATASVVSVACILLILALSRKKLVKLCRRVEGNRFKGTEVETFLETSSPDDIVNGENLSNTSEPLTIDGICAHKQIVRHHSPYKDNVTEMLQDEERAESVRMREERGHHSNYSWDVGGLEDCLTLHDTISC